jgi:hypothetical protein
MKEFKSVLGMVGTVINLIILILGVWLVLKTGPEELFNNPAYAIGVIIFYYLITKDAGDMVE